MFPLLFGTMTTRVSLMSLQLLNHFFFSTFPSPLLALCGSQPFHVLASQNLHWHVLISPTTLTSVS